MIKRTLLRGPPVGWRITVSAYLFHDMAAICFFSRYYVIWNSGVEGMAVLSIFFGGISVSVVKFDGITVSRPPIKHLLDKAEIRMEN